MTKAYLQSLKHVELIDIAIKLRILPHNFREVRHTHSENLLDSDEQQDLIDEIYDILAEQHSESLDDLTPPLIASLHKFEIERDGSCGLASPLPCNYFTDQLGMTKNKLHLILRDMEWAVIFWQLSTSIQQLIKEEEQQNQYSTEESSLSIAVHESPTMPKFGRQSRPDALQGSYSKDYYMFSNNLKTNDSKTDSYFFSINNHEYKRYIFLKNDYNWTELYHYNKSYQRKVLLARSAILYKPKLLQLDQVCEEKARKLFELSNGEPEGLETYISSLSSENIA